MHLALIEAVESEAEEEVPTIETIYISAYDRIRELEQSSNRDADR